MSELRYKPVTITRDFYQLGTPSYPAYLSMGDDGMIIEGGVGLTFTIIVDQIKELGISPDRIKYLTLTHTHPDHVGAVPHLRKLWPHLKVLGGSIAAEQLKKEEAVQEIIRMDSVITEIEMIKGHIAEWPPEFVDPNFEVDTVLKEGDKLDLGSGIVWTMYDTPGHSPCHTSLYNESQGILVIGDATGLYDSEKNLFWPNYFDSLEKYCNSIRKLSTLPAQVGVLSHHSIIKGDVRQHLERAMKATESYHTDLLKKLDSGGDPKKIALETAQWVYTFTNLQPFKVIHGLTRLMMKHSQSVDRAENLFTLP